MNKSLVGLLLVLVLVVLLASSAQAQSCAGEMKPMKPVWRPGAVGDATPTCLCDEGMNCHWIWTWPTGTSVTTPRAVEPTRPAGGIDTSMYQMLDTPQIDMFGSLLDKAIQIQRLRNLQQQNQMIERMNQAPPVQAPPLQPTRAQMVELDPDEIEGPRETGGRSNGWYWRRMGGNAKVYWLDAYWEGIRWASQKPEDAAWTMPHRITFGELRARIDKFYDDPLNRPIPIVSTLSWLRMQEEGTDEAMLERFLVERREFAAAILVKAKQQ